MRKSRLAELERISRIDGPETLCLKGEHQVMVDQWDKRAAVILLRLQDLEPGKIKMVLERALMWQEFLG